MSTSLYSLMIGTDHAVSVSPQGGKAVVTVDLTGGTVFFSDNSQVSASNNQGSIAPGGSQTFTAMTWLRGSALAGAQVQVTPGTGVQTLRASAGAFTASQTRDVVFTWATPFADANYTLSVVLVDVAASGNSPALREVVGAQTASGFTVRITSGATGAVTDGQLLVHALAIHD